EEDVLAHLTRRARDLEQIIGFKILHSRTELQTLQFSPVFAEFPNQMAGLVRTVESLRDRLQDCAESRINNGEKRLAAIAAGLSPMQISARLGSGRTRYALFCQRHCTAAADMIARKAKSLKLCTATLDALSPLAVLNRGFSITQNEQGSILRSASDVSMGDNLKIRLAEGSLKAKVLEAESSGE
ncbi:MAG: exodeoxyribonuclease VII large subunit, partial [Pyrinomonadaceae bacterium]